VATNGAFVCMFYKAGGASCVRTADPLRLVSVFRCLSQFSLFGHVDLSSSRGICKGFVVSVGFDAVFG